MKQDWVWCARRRRWGGWRAAVQDGLRDESGVALIFAMVFMLVLTLVLAATLELTSSGARSANRVKADTVAFSLAEAGLNAGASVLSAPGTPVTSGSVPREGGAPGEEAAWTATLQVGEPCPSGAADCTLWEIESVAAVNNPTGPDAAMVHRTVSALFERSEAPAGPGVTGPVLTLVKNANRSTFSGAGAAITYTYTVGNDGDESVSGPVQVTDEITSTTATPTHPPCPAVSTVGNNDGSLDPGESLVCTSSYVTTGTDVTAGRVVNEAFATAATLDSNTDEETVTYVPGPSTGPPPPPPLPFGGAFLYSSGNITFSGGSASEMALIADGWLKLTGAADAATTVISIRGVADFSSYVGVGPKAVLTAAMTPTQTAAAVSTTAGFSSSGTIKIYNEYMSYTGKGTTAADCTFLRTTLTLAMTTSSTTATVASTSDLPASGIVLIDSEKITYSGKTATTLTGLGRRAAGSPLQAHSVGAGVNEFALPPPCFTGLTRGTLGTVAASHATDLFVTGAPPPTLTAAMDSIQSKAGVTSVAGFPTALDLNDWAYAGVFAIVNSGDTSVEYIAYRGVGTDATACNPVPAPCFTGLGRAYVPGYPAAPHAAGANVDGRIAEVHLKVPCEGNCDQVHSATTIDTNLVQDRPEWILPVFDMRWGRDNAAPGPSHPPSPACSILPAPPSPAPAPTTQSYYWYGSEVDLTPDTNYSCTNGTGQISWNAAETKLTLRGIIYLPSNVKVTKSLIYDAPSPGSTLYIAGKFTIGSAKNICGLRPSTTLAAALSNVATTANVVSTSGFPDMLAYKGDKGWFKVDNEVIKYSGWVADDPYTTGVNEAKLTGLTRTAGASHAVGAVVTETAACDLSNWNPNVGNELALVGADLPAGVSNPAHDFTFSGGATFQGLTKNDGKLTISGGGILSGTGMADEIIYSGGAAAPAPGIFSIAPGFGTPPPTPPPAPMLTLVKHASRATFPGPGTLVAYTYTVRNEGDAAATGPVTVTDTAVATTPAASDTLSVTCPSLTTVGDGDTALDVGESITCSATHTINATGGTVTNTATAHAGASASNEDSERVTFQPLPPPGPPPTSGTPLEVRLVPGSFSG